MSLRIPFLLDSPKSGALGRTRNETAEARRKTIPADTNGIGNPRS